jgi:hypothetical protein
VSLRTRPHTGKDPWRRAPVGELQDQVLPRWFVLVAIAMVLVFAGVVVAAFVISGPREVPVAERRPPPARGLTTGVGAYQVGEALPVQVSNLCPTLDGVLVAGEQINRDALVAALREICLIRIDAGAAARMQSFARAGGLLRFASFESTGVDVTADPGSAPPRILVNARFARTDPTWIAPLIAYQATLLASDPALAESALAARAAEADVCAKVFTDRPPPPGCADANELLALDDPVGALREAGYSS